MSIIEKLNISYNSNNNEQQQLDLYYPNDDNGKDRTLVIYIHGGFWVARDKKEYSNLGKYLAEKVNVACAVINYRLSSDKHKETERILYPEHNYDLIESIVWLIQNNCDDKGKEMYSNSKIVLMGHSCGGHMISTVALNWDLYIDQMIKDNKNRFKQFNETYKQLKTSIKGCIGIQGLYDFVALHEDFPNYLEDIKIVFNDDWFDTTNIKETTLDRSNTSWLIIHSPEDTWVNRRQSVNAVNHLRNVLKFDKVQLEENVKGPHFEVVTNFGNLSVIDADNTREIVKNYLNKI
ncbi:hypothetical protein DICPUDRAFT_154506 [Dictyostelium purpureum]|uniref:Kynurenine formamidase n=1 Tax=Dictyostelium purpureum TaxID=5786 RepID=F0ZRI3_DICPU|nr:uncharacterized protein DICPUDRAFT_154506 [Dictyostelium purpureum]EGC33459.1 hypothetical protein DICPUDRAFT_154506 [Dictyostelium purpureum]|eukprot:XP_003290030.1 hypothetical protein DICPUDRAFT_154506 [Dictyostelium purpureum]